MNVQQETNKHPLEVKPPKDAKFRVTCLRPLGVAGFLIVRDEEEVTETGVLSGGTKLCDRPTYMTIDEINDRLVMPGHPYVRIDYCEHCRVENTIGIVDDVEEAKKYKGILNWPDGLRLRYYFRKLPI